MRSVNKRWTLIDKSILSMLPCLDDADPCYYYLVRSPGGYSASFANSRIEDFKKNPERYRDNPAVWRYKLAEIQNFADDIAMLLNNPGLAKVIADFQPVAITAMPTSKPKSDLYHDSRIDDLCAEVTKRVAGIGWASPFDVSARISPSHLNGPRDVATLEASLSFNGFGKEPGLVFLVDDVLTTGAHFTACRNIIRRHHPSVPIIGVFLCIHRSDYRDWSKTGL